MKKEDGDCNYEIWWDTPKACPLTVSLRMELSYHWCIYVMSAIFSAFFVGRVDLKVEYAK